MSRCNPAEGSVSGYASLGDSVQVLGILIVWSLFTAKVWGLHICGRYPLFLSMSPGCHLWLWSWQRVSLVFVHLLSIYISYFLKYLLKVFFLIVFVVPFMKKCTICMCDLLLSYKTIYLYVWICKSIFIYVINNQIKTNLFPLIL